MRPPVGGRRRILGEIEPASARGRPGRGGRGGGRGGLLGRHGGRRRPRCGPWAFSSPGQASWPRGLHPPPAIRRKPGSARGAGPPDRHQPKPPRGPARSAAGSPAARSSRVNSLAVTVCVQGVRQTWPSDVLASAPAGSDSNCMVVAAGADFRKVGVSNCIQLGMLEHPARLNAQAAIAATRFMATTVHSCSPTAALH